MSDTDAPFPSGSRGRSPRPPNRASPKWTARRSTTCRWNAPIRTSRRCCSRTAFARTRAGGVSSRRSFSAASASSSIDFAGMGDSGNRREYTPLGFVARHRRRARSCGLRQGDAGRSQLRRRPRRARLRRGSRASVARAVIIDSHMRLTDEKRSTRPFEMRPATRLSDVRSGARAVSAGAAGESRGAVHARLRRAALAEGSRRRLDLEVRRAAASRSTTTPRRRTSSRASRCRWRSSTATTARSCRASTRTRSCSTFRTRAVRSRFRNRIITCCWISRCRWSPALQSAVCTERPHSRRVLQVRALVLAGLGLEHPLVADRVAQLQRVDRFRQRDAVADEQARRQELAEHQRGVRLAGAVGRALDADFLDADAAAELRSEEAAALQRQRVARGADASRCRCR